MTVSRTWRARLGAVTWLLLAAVSAAACGDGLTGPARARENAAAPSCTDWSTGAPVPCGVDARGPGGGRVFHDAGSLQPWGQYLEVAPQGWNGALHDCPGTRWWTGSGCEYAAPAEDGTSDFGPDPDSGYRICGPTAAGYRGGTDTAIGSGRTNTATLLADPGCTTGEVSALTLATAYDGGGYTDWYLPSLDEMTALCRYGGLDTIGGFPNKGSYATSSAHQSGDTEFFDVLRFDRGSKKQPCPSADWPNPPAKGDRAPLGVRPIRSF
jgi:hypothetical protein